MVAAGLLVVLLVALSACAPEVEPRCVISPVDPMAEGDTAVLGGWCPGDVPLLVVDPSWTCDAGVLDQARGFWSAREKRFEVTHGAAPAMGGGEDGRVYLKLVPVGSVGPGRSGNAYWTFDADALFMKRVSIQLEDCDPLRLAHELGHALGYDDAGRVGTVMAHSPHDQAWEIRASEIAALELSK